MLPQLSHQRIRHRLPLRTLDNQIRTDQTRRQQPDQIRLTRRILKHTQLISPQLVLAGDATPQPAPSITKINRDRRFRSHK